MEFDYNNYRVYDNEPVNARIRIEVDKNQFNMLFEYSKGCPRKKKKMIRRNLRKIESFANQLNKRYANKQQKQ